MMETVGWATAIVAVLALVGLLVVVVLRKGRADVKLGVGPVSLGAKASARSQAVISDSTSLEGGAAARSSGDAAILRVNAKKDLTAEAGGDRGNPKA